MSHDLRRNHAHGHGAWLQCEKCGSTKHSGHWWYGGRKSKTEPDCPPSDEWNGIDIYELEQANQA